MNDSGIEQLNEIIPEGCEPPPGYPLSKYGPLLFDGGSSSKVYAWGYRILHQLEEERFQSLGQYGKLICLSRGNWALVVKWLTPEEAIEKYGPITHQAFGPYGGWRSVTYGTTQFTAKELKPSPELESKFDYEKEILPKNGTLEADNSWVFYRISQIRKESRYSIEKFAILLGVSKETIVNWEKSQTKK